MKIPRASLEGLITGEKGKEFVQQTARKLVEYESTQNGGSAKDTSTSTETSTSTGNGTGTGSTSENLNSVDLGGDGGNFIPSLLDDNLTLLAILINCEILTNIMILYCHVEKA